MSQIIRSHGTSLHLLSVLAWSPVPSPAGRMWYRPGAVSVCLCACVHKGVVQWLPGIICLIN